MRRSLLLLIAGLLLLVATACDLGAGGPNGPATATAVTADNATVTALQPLALTFSARPTNHDHRAERAVRRPPPPDHRATRDQGTTTDAGKDATRIGITVQNGDKTAHQVVVRVYYKDAPLNTQDYGVGAVNVPANGSAATSVVWPLPFKLAAAQVLQIDNIWITARRPTCPDPTAPDRPPTRRCASAGRGSAATASRVVTPVRTRIVSRPLSMPMMMSVSMRSPIITASSEWASMVAQRGAQHERVGLAHIVGRDARGPLDQRGHRAGGRPMPPSAGPLGSGFVAMKRAPPRISRMARVMRSKL